MEAAGWWSILAGLVLVLTRVGTVFLFSPYFGAPFLPGTVRICCALALSVLVVTTTPGTSPDLPGAGELGLTLLGEVGAGVLLSLGLALAFYAAQLAGSLVDYQLGFGFAAVTDPSQPAPTPMLGRFYYYLALAVFLAVGGDRAFLATVWTSFRLLPPGRVFLDEAVATGLALRAASAFALGIQLAAPVLAALFLTDILLGMVARTVPQLNPFFIGLPLKAATGIVVLAGALPAVVAVLRGAFSTITASLVELMSLAP